MIFMSQDFTLKPFHMANIITYYYYFFQEDVYNECVAPLTQSFFDGFNATVFAHGQTVNLFC